MEERLENRIISRTEHTMSDTCILDTGGEQETHIRTEVPPLTKSEIQRVLNAVKETVTSGDMVILAGDLPSGSSDDIYARLISNIHAAGAEAIVAASGPALEAALKAGPQLVVLNQIQCEGLFNIPIRVIEDVVMAGHKLLERGAGSALLEMKESAGAILVTDEGLWQVDMPESFGGTTSGVWDALLAGFLAGRCLKAPIDESLELAGAAAAFAADEVGVEFGSTEDLEPYHVEVRVHELDDNQTDASLPQG
jgi:1-phosphofructokinase